jgi:hypothetical protein
MRYVRDQLVLRMRIPLTPEQIEHIQTEFADIVSEGGFEQTDALPEEAGEKELAHLPRLVFHFNRRALGRLRMLINVINGHPTTESPTLSSR